MSALAAALQMFEGAPLPDFARRAAVNWMVGGARRKMLTVDPAAEAAFAREMADYPVAEHTDAANAQHYEVPARFFQLILGPHLKYSCCLYGPDARSLGEAEAKALAESCDHAGLADGQEILELGCGWGSLSLWMAKAYPRSKITSVSNSASQRAFIEGEARARGLTNLNVITCDMNNFQTTGRFDRVVSVEMFEHMSNWRALLGRIRGWLRPDGRLFLHVFTHRSTPYRFDVRDKTDWIAQHFFTGGVMPSHGLIRHFPDAFEVEADWRWNGGHYARTARDWLANYDANAAEVAGVLRQVYGSDAVLWGRRWRLFFLATEGLFGHAGGEEWAVSHYRLKPA